MKLDVGCGAGRRPGFTGIDRLPSQGVDLLHDLRVFPWPVAAASCTEIVLDNVIEHLPDLVGTMDELHRIAAPGARVFISYPYWRSFGCHSDPTHVHYLNEYMIDHFLRPGSSPRPENRYSYYTGLYWKLERRRLVTYRFLRWIPGRMLSLVSRHACDVVHSVELSLTPDK